MIDQSDYQKENQRNPPHAKTQVLWDIALNFRFKYGHILKKKKKKKEV